MIKFNNFKLLVVFFFAGFSLVSINSIASNSKNTENNNFENQRTAVDPAILIFSQTPSDNEFPRTVGTINRDSSGFEVQFDTGDALDFLDNLNPLNWFSTDGKETSSTKVNNNSTNYKPDYKSRTVSDTSQQQSNTKANSKSAAPVINDNKKEASDFIFSSKNNKASSNPPGLVQQQEIVDKRLSELQKAKKSNNVDKSLADAAKRKPKELSKLEEQKSDKQADVVDKIDKADIAEVEELSSIEVIDREAERKKSEELAAQRKNDWRYQRQWWQRGASSPVL